MADELRDELTNDPLQRGYAQMTDKQAADSLNAADVEQDRTIVPAHEIVDAIVPSEWTVLTDIERGRIGFVVSAGEVNVKAPNVRTAFTTAFAGGTATRTALTTLLTEMVTRASQLGLGRVKVGHVQEARR